VEDEVPENGLISVFSPRIICGEEVEPFCLPTRGTNTSHLIAASTNLVWWAMHEALADGNISDAEGCGHILLDIVGRELTDEQKLEASAMIEDVFERYREIPDDLN
jgi:hypothetical protein